MQRMVMRLAFTALGCWGVLAGGYVHAGSHRPLAGAGRRDLRHEISVLTRSSVAQTMRDETWELGPEDAQACAKQGDEWRTAGEYDKALTAYDTAICISPNCVEAFIGRALVYCKKGNYERASPPACTATFFDPRNALAWAIYGRVLLGQGDAGAARGACTRALRLDSRCALALAVRGETYRGEKDLAKALSDLDRAIEIDPNEALAYYHRGLLWADKGEQDDARAVTMSPCHPPRWAKKGGPKSRIIDRRDRPTLASGTAG